MSERSALQAGAWYAPREIGQLVSPAWLERSIGLAESSKRSLSLFRTGAALGRNRLGKAGRLQLKPDACKMRRASGFVNRAPAWPNTRGFRTLRLTGTQADA